MSSRRCLVFLCDCILSALLCVSDAAVLPSGGRGLVPTMCRVLHVTRVVSVCVFSFICWSGSGSHQCPGSLCARVLSCLPISFVSVRLVVFGGRSFDHRSGSGSRQSLVTSRLSCLHVSCCSFGCVGGWGVFRTFHASPHRLASSTCRSSSLFAPHPTSHHPQPAYLGVGSFGFCRGILIMDPPFFSLMRPLRVG